LAAQNSVAAKFAPPAGGEFLSAMAIGWIVFALVLGSALPEHHLSADSKDVVKLGIALVATQRWLSSASRLGS